MREGKNNTIFLPMHLETWSWHLLKWRRFREGTGSLV